LKAHTRTHLAHIGNITHMANEIYKHLICINHVVLELVSAILEYLHIKPIQTQLKLK